MMLTAKTSVFFATLLFLLHGIVPHAHGTEARADEAQWRSKAGVVQHLFSADLGAHHLEFARNEVQNDHQKEACVACAATCVFQAVGSIDCAHIRLTAPHPPTLLLRPGHGRAFALRPPPLK
jgi:hypothetical protein